MRFSLPSRLFSSGALVILSLLAVAVAVILYFLSDGSGGDPERKAQVKVRAVGSRSEEQSSENGSSFRINSQEAVSRLKKNYPIDHLLSEWDKIAKSDLSESVQLEELRGLAATMALTGYLDLATEKTLTSFGPGEKRCMIIRNAFRFSSSVEQTAKAFALLEFDDEMKAGAEGLGKALAVALGEEAIPNESDYAQYGFLEDHMGSMYSAFAENIVAIRASQGGEGITSATVASVLELPMKKNVRNAVLRKLYYSAPFDCWDYIDRRDDSYRIKDQSSLLDQMFREDEARTAELLISSKRGGDLLAPAFRHWMSMDATAPVNWLESNSSRLNALARDRAYSGIADYALQQGELETARIWVDQIRDPALKAKLVTKIDSTIKPE